MNRDEREQRDVSRGLPPRLDPRAGKPPRRGPRTASNEPTSSAGRSGGAAARGGRIVATLLSLTLLRQRVGLAPRSRRRSRGEPDRRHPHVGQRPERPHRRGDEPAARGQRQPFRPHRRAAARAADRQGCGPEHRHDDPGARPGRRVEGVVRLLPRDSYVQIPGYGQDKLNAAYAYGYRDAPENASEDAKLAAGAQLLVPDHQLADRPADRPLRRGRPARLFNLSSVVRRRGGQPVRAGQRPPLLWGRSSTPACRPSRASTR